MEKIKLFVAIPSTNWVTDYQAHILRKIEKRYADKIEFIYPENVVHRFAHDYARNALVEDFLASGADIMWFLDSDVGPPPQILDLITVHGDKWQAAGAAYPVIMTQGGSNVRQLTFTAYKGTDGRGMAPADIPFEGTDWVDGIATGCLFLKRGVFLRLQKPYFEFEFDKETRQPTRGEDLGFCVKLNQLGIKFFIDYTLCCSHVKEIDLLEMNNYAMDFARRSVEAYAKQVKQELAAQALAIAAAKREKANKPQIWLPK